MEIGNEISQKIRSAIKAKLVELGAYVDDELPDYIMVLVANKKTQQQMSEDLSLFLGKNTDNFTTWLQFLLTKLQSITAEIPQKKAPVQAQQKPPPDSPPITKSVISENLGQPIKSNVPTAIVNETRPDVSNERIKQPKQSEEITPKAQREEPVLTFTAENDEFVEEDIQKEKPSQTKKSLSSTTKKSPEVTAKIIPRVRARSPINSQESSSRVSSMVSKISRAKSPPQHIVAVSPQKVERSRSTNRKPGNRPSTSRSSQQDRHRGSSSSQLVRQHRGPGSVVASVIHHQQESDDEYDPMNPSVGNVASVVRVTERRSSIPPAMQANKSLLMKAVSEARKSIDSSTKRMEEKGRITISRSHQRTQISPNQHVRTISSERNRAIKLPSRQDYQEKSVSAIRPTRSSVTSSNRASRGKINLVSRSSREDPLYSSRMDDVKCIRIQQVVNTDRNSEDETGDSSPDPAITGELRNEGIDLDLTEEIEFDEDQRVIECQDSPPEPRSQHAHYTDDSEHSELKDTVQSQLPDYLEGAETEELPSYVDSDQENYDLATEVIMEQPRKVEPKKKKVPTATLR